MFPLLLLMTCRRSEGADVAKSCGGKTLKTGEETSQPDKNAVAYWATGLEPVFLEGALKRAK